MRDDEKQQGDGSKTPTVFYLTGRPPLFVSFWLLTIEAFFGVYWLFTHVAGHYGGAVLPAFLITFVTAMVLKDSMLRTPPYKM